MHIPLPLLYKDLVFIVFTATPLKPAFQLKQVYPELLDAVADKISYDFLQVGLELGFSFYEVERFRMDFNINTLGAIRAMLREWYNRYKKDDKATIGWLANALLNTGRSDINSLIEMEETAFQENRTSFFSNLKDWFLSGKHFH